MKKSIITIALLGLAGHAAADVTLYGEIRNSISVESVKIKGSNGVTEKAPAPPSMTTYPASVSKAARS
ncbi:MULTISPECIES: hypothetical protein [Neisseria]|uniref:hypothetical protein n=1 Tax=Neisseria TaxID=482 RepID=UPI001E4F87C8|nr:MULTISPECIES: hypothetical protein [Neisseria]